jgi:hypothetical protein
VKLSAAVVSSNEHFVRGVQRMYGNSCGGGPPP